MNSCLYVLTMDIIKLKVTIHGSEQLQLKKKGCFYYEEKV